MKSSKIWLLVMAAVVLTVGLNGALAVRSAMKMDRVRQAMGIETEPRRGSLLEDTDSSDSPGSDPFDFGDTSAEETPFVDSSGSDPFEDASASDSWWRMPKSQDEQVALGFLSAYVGHNFATAAGYLNLSEERLAQPSVSQDEAEQWCRDAIAQGIGYYEACYGPNQVAGAFIPYALPSALDSGATYNTLGVVDTSAWDIDSKGIAILLNSAVGYQLVFVNVESGKLAPCAF